MKCLFIISDLDMGGITSSLRNLCNELVNKGAQVDILNLPKVKRLPNGFDKRVRLVPVFGKAIYWNLGMENVAEARLLKKPFLLCLGLVKKILTRYKKWNLFIFSQMPKLTGYDAAIAFRQGPTNYYIVSHKTDAKYKVGFWHGDPTYMGDTSLWDSCVYEMDRIACVSDAVSSEMEKKYPPLVGKVCTVYNIFDADQIKKQGEESAVVLNQNYFNIVTVARIEFEQKQLQMIPVICRKLKQAGALFNWTIVGDGPDMLQLKQLIEQEKVSDCLLLVGSKENPYPYIKQADLFVLTSIWESYGMVIMESLILGTPVVASEYPALKEILSHEKEGMIAPNCLEGVFETVYQVITDEKLYQKLKANCMEYKYDSEFTYKQFLKLIGENDA